MTSRSLRIAGAIQAPKGQKMDPQMYWSYLTDRVQSMIDKAEDPMSAMAEIYSQLLESDLAANEPETVETAARSLIRENPNLQAYLIRQGVLETLPKKMLMDDPDAKMTIEKSDADLWLTSVMEGVHSS